MSAAKRLSLSPRMFAIMRALAKRRDPYDDAVRKPQRTRIAAALEILARRRLITHTNVVAEPWKLTNEGAELLRLRDLGEQRIEERRRRAFEGYARRR